MSNDKLQMSEECQNPNEKIFDICYLGFIWTSNFGIWHCFTNDYRLPRSLGSMASRNPSPNRLKERTVMRIANPGKTVSHHASKI